MLIWIISLLFLAAAGCFWFCRQLFPALIKNKALGTLNKVIFPQGETQKQAVLKTFHGFTKERFSDEQIMDYFMKIKGLQNLSIGSSTNFWVKKYLLSPTKIKLNYFEQVKFYELFMNFPTTKTSNPPVIAISNHPASNKEEKPFDKVQPKPSLKQALKPKTV
ncbi:MAG: hypothetical protein LC643_09675 [Bacteroidales bacterium]|nr:hypothetical protein [Bacteroidales bacterium]